MSHNDNDNNDSGHSSTDHGKHWMPTYHHSDHSPVPDQKSFLLIFYQLDHFANSDLVLAIIYSCTDHFSFFLVSSLLVTSLYKFSKFWSIFYPDSWSFSLFHPDHFPSPFSSHSDHFLLSFPLILITFSTFLLILITIFLLSSHSDHFFPPFLTSWSLPLPPDQTSFGPPPPLLLYLLSAPVVPPHFRWPVRHSTVVASLQKRDQWSVSASATNARWRWVNSGDQKIPFLSG